MMTSRAQVRRLLALVPYLREHDGVPLTEVAAAFGISPVTLRADLDVLWMCGMPGLTPGDLIDIDMDAVDGEGVIHLSNADYLPRPLRLSGDEALALVLALRTLRGIAGPGKRAAIDSALAKLEAVAGSQAHSAQAAVLVQGGRDEIQAQVSDGLQRGKRLDLTYDVATRAETTRRQVDPLRVFVLDGYGYLEAWCYLADGLRTFRLDRIAAVEVTETDIVEHDVTLRDLSGGWFDALADAPLVDPGPRPARRLDRRVLPDRAGHATSRRRAGGHRPGQSPAVVGGHAAPPRRARAGAVAARGRRLRRRGRPGGAGPVRGARAGVGSLRCSGSSCSW